MTQSFLYLEMRLPEKSRPFVVCDTYGVYELILSMGQSSINIQIAFFAAMAVQCLCVAVFNLNDSEKIIVGNG